MVNIIEIIDTAIAARDNETKLKTVNNKTEKIKITFLFRLINQINGKRRIESCCVCKISLKYEPSSSNVILSPTVSAARKPYLLKYNNEHKDEINNKNEIIFINFSVTYVLLSWLKKNKNIIDNDESKSITMKLRKFIFNNP